MAKAALLPMFTHQYFDNTGGVLAGGKLYFYEPGTTTEKDTYTDSSLGTPNPNPIILDSSGRPDNGGSAIQIWLDGAYKLVVKDSNDVTIRTDDNITSLAEASSYVAKTTDYTVVASDFGKLVNVDATSNNITISLTAAATLGSGFKFSIAKSDSSSNTVTIDANSSETLNGATTHVLYAQYDSVDIICDGSNFFITAKQYGSISQNATDIEITDDVEITAGNLTLTNGDINMTSGDLTMTAGNYVITAGNATLTLGDLTLTAGNLAMTAGNFTMTAGDFTMSAGAISATDDTGHELIVSDAGTTNEPKALTLRHITSGTATTEIGVALSMECEAADGTVNEICGFFADYTDASTGAEDSRLRLNLVQAGTTQLSYIFQNDPSATTYTSLTNSATTARTVTLPDFNHKIGTLKGSFAASFSVSVGTSTDTTVSGYTEVLDTDSYFAANRYTPLVSGKYLALVTGFIDSAIGDGKELRMGIRKNGSDVQLAGQGVGAAVNPGITSQATVSCNGSTDYIDFEAYQNNGDTKTVSGKVTIFRIGD